MESVDTFFSSDEQGTLFSSSNQDVLFPIERKRKTYSLFEVDAPFLFGKEGTFFVVGRIGLTFFVG